MLFSSANPSYCVHHRKRITSAMYLAIFDYSREHGDPQNFKQIDGCLGF